MNEPLSDAMLEYIEQQQLEEYEAFMNAEPFDEDDDAN